MSCGARATNLKMLVWKLLCAPSRLYVRIATVSILWRSREPTGWAKSSPRPNSDDRMIKKSASCVLASLRGSTYGLGKRLFRQAMGGRVEKIYASPQDTAGSPSRRRAQPWCHLFVTPCASLRSCWTAFLIILSYCLLSPEANRWDGYRSWIFLVGC